MTDNVNISLSKIVIEGHTPANQIGELCRALSTDEVEVSGRIEFRKDRVVIYLVGENRANAIPEYLRK